MNNDMIFSMGTHTYIAHIEEDKIDGGYVASFPSLPGCHTQGKTLEEVIAMAKDVLEGYLMWLKNDGKSLPIENDSLLKRQSKINIPLSVIV